ncbi:MAG: type II secretion system GspH family protein, partial [Clostridia bacterium]|nr:type II secretion system GspH family protein [Clostridia bacterium]
MFLKSIKKKAGFGLTECVVALLLFSIITGSVLTIMTTSRNQVRKQNDKYKMDLMANNILAAYEGCDDYDTFLKVLKTLNIGTQVTGMAGKSYEGESGSASEGTYGFDPNNVPMPVDFDKITVTPGKNGTGSAVFFDADGKTLASFPGDYTGGVLSEMSDYGWKPDDIYTHSNDYAVSGKVKLIEKDNAEYSYTYKITADNKVNFSLTPPTGTGKTVTRNACDFEQYLYEHKYYLLCVNKFKT